MVFKNYLETFFALSRSPLIGIVYCYQFHLVSSILVFFRPHKQNCSLSLRPQLSVPPGHLSGEKD